MYTYVQARNFCILDEITTYIHVRVGTVKSSVKAGSTVTSIRHCTCMCTCICPMKSVYSGSTVLGKVQILVRSKHHLSSV